MNTMFTIRDCRACSTMYIVNFPTMKFYVRGTERRFCHGGNITCSVHGDGTIIEGKMKTCKLNLHDMDLKRLFKQRFRANALGSV